MRVSVYKVQKYKNKIKNLKKNNFSYRGLEIDYFCTFVRKTKKTIDITGFDTGTKMKFYWYKNENWYKFLY
jgi:hypothetical protein